MQAAETSLYRWRDLLIGLACLTPVVAFWSSLYAVFAMAFHDDRYLQVIAAPLISFVLLFWNRGQIFSQTRYSPRVGIPLLLAVVLIGATFRCGPVPQNAVFVATVLATVGIWIAAFVLRFGMQSFRAGLYPVGCLLLMIPPTSPWMDWIAATLQYLSAAVSYELLTLSGIPVLRHGMRFSLPGLEFEVGPECSGIRSSLALMMVALVAAYLCLRSRWLRAALLFLTLPIVIFKNAVRIAVLSSVGAYWDRAFLDGPIHHRYGGLLFSVIGVALFVLMLRGLQILERRRPTLNYLVDAKHAV